MRTSSPWVIVVHLLVLLNSACVKSSKKYNLDQPHKERQLILTLKSGESMAEFVASHGLDQTDVEVINSRSVLLRFDANQVIDLEAKADSLQNDHRIKTIEANQLYQLYDKRPNDPDFAKLYGLNNEGQLGGRVGADLGMLKAWDVVTGSKSVVVGVIDTGIDYNHPDLAENIWTNPGEQGLDAAGQEKRSNGLDDDDNGFVDDWHGWDFYNSDNDPMDDNSHGSHVAGTIGGRGNNGIGVAGINWEVAMVPIKVFSAGGASSSDILIRAIDYATSLRVLASNNSWGGGDFSEAMLSSIKNALDKDVLFIAAAGNDSASNDSGKNYPSTYPSANIISVAATDRHDVLATYSNYGNQSVDVAAPGTDIWSTTPNNTYGLKSGTSMATPHVTGLVALLKASFPRYSAMQIKAKILASAVPTVQLQSKVRYGRINALAGLEVDTIPPGAVPDFKITAIGIKGLSLVWNEAGDDADTGKANRYQLRWSNTQILTESDWQAAKIVAVQNLLWQDKHWTAEVSDMTFNQQGFIAIRAIDNAANLGDLSLGLNFSLQPVTVLVDEGHETSVFWTKLDSPWGVDVQDGMSFLADSPKEIYERNLDIAAESREIAVTQSDLILDIRSRYELERGYDFGFVEISIDGGKTYKELAKFTGQKAWSDTSYKLRPFIKNAESFRLRLRLKTDTSLNFEGLDIDRLQIIGY